MFWKMKIILNISDVICFIILRRVYLFLGIASGYIIPFGTFYTLSHFGRKPMPARFCEICLADLLKRMWNHREMENGVGRIITAFEQGTLHGARSVSSHGFNSIYLHLAASRLVLLQAVHRCHSGIKSQVQDYWSKLIIFYRWRLITINTANTRPLCPFGYTRI